jgi:hypothetical protein
MNERDSAFDSGFFQYGTYLVCYDNKTFSRVTFNILINSNINQDDNSKYHADHPISGPKALKDARDKQQLCTCDQKRV